MKKIKRTGKRQQLVTSTCLHCSKEFQHSEIYSQDYCSKKCSYIYNPIPTVPRPAVPPQLQKLFKGMRNISTLIRTINQSFRHSVIAQIKDLKGLHQFEQKQGISENVTDEKVLEMKKDLRASFLDSVKQMNYSVSHLSEKAIDAKVDELFEFLQSIIFIKPSKDLPA